jgi:hypothetical protein
MSDYLESHWPPPRSFLSARRRRYAIGAAIVTPIVHTSECSATCTPGGPLT